MNASCRTVRLVEDLAASWTAPVLEALKAAGIDQLSVERELETWHTLKSALRYELRRQQAFRAPMLMSVSTLMEQVL